MTTARHLDVIDLLRVRDFPAERGRSGAITSGPGYHLVELSTSEDFWDDDGSRRVEVQEQYEAECEALAALLSARWGAAQMFSLWSVLTRGMEGEEIAEPWDELSNSVPYLHLWRADGRWVAVGVSQWDTELEFQLMAVVTEVDPP
ncbi:hypothetical protein A8W25_03010 [Streptomyces sp. ERV7]|uniref:hypothetical protein n=1 Tax=Streptomyces sp. ERV7 TaxID=1322334 RepID=UPI0007F37770|nr:hypothetical protein [Streptomyces sp. ERV7]OAR27247.1 hypothetical protein A8W25_03010 [Streptomyces sp. ERV7]